MKEQPQPSRTIKPLDEDEAEFEKWREQFLNEGRIMGMKFIEAEVAVGAKWLLQMPDEWHMQFVKLIACEPGTEAASWAAMSVGMKLLLFKAAQIGWNLLSMKFGEHLKSLQAAAKQQEKEQRAKGKG